ncbi:MAG: UTRA domain-containing protein [Aquabacterium sp.]|nr:UTRA domain-containing protein [Aquabacterium sp.]
MVSNRQAPYAAVQQSLKDGLAACALMPGKAALVARHGVSRMTDTTPTQVRADTTALWRAQHSIQAEPATADEARPLAIAPGSACLVVTRRTFTRDATIALVQQVHPGRHDSLHGEFQP